jgi:3-hydroxyacyl-CoA dehydrogenase
MFYASRIGLGQVVRRMNGFAKNPHADASFWKPAKLLATLAAQGRSFEDGKEKRRG